LPALAALVVEHSTGMPAPGFAAVARKDIARAQSRVWEFDWFSIIPPAVEDLAENALVQKHRQTEQHVTRRGKQAASKASKLAGRVIDRRADPSAPIAERERRKRRLLKGPKEFRDIRRDRANAKD
jgi:hypothetical protein